MLCKVAFGLVWQRLRHRMGYGCCPLHRSDVRDIPFIVKTPHTSTMSSQRRYSPSSTFTNQFPSIPTAKSNGSRTSLRVYFEANVLFPAITTVFSSKNRIVFAACLFPGFVVGLMPARFPRWLKTSVTQAPIPREPYLRSVIERNAPPCR